MTSDIPAGRELDRRVAEAMGWTDVGDRVWLPEGVRKLEGYDPAKGFTRELPHYSTEFGPWTQEMLDWLVNDDNGVPRVCYLRLSIDEGGAYARLDDVGVRAEWGWSIPEALARLVLAVKEARDGHE